MVTDPVQWTPMVIGSVPVNKDGAKMTKVAALKTLTSVPTVPIPVQEIHLSGASILQEVSGVVLVRKATPATAFSATMSMNV